MDDSNDILNPFSLRKGDGDYTKTILAYQDAVNEVAIVSITDLAGAIIYVNKKFTEISQFDAGELLGKTHRIINSGHHPTAFFSEMWQSITAGKPWRGEIKNRAKDGSFYWVDTVIVPVKDANENIFQYLSIRNLITAQKEHEERSERFLEALLKRKRQLKDAQEVAKTGSWHYSIPDDLLEWSEETYRIFEIPIGRPMTYELFLQSVHPDDHDLVDSAWQTALKTGHYEMEHRIVTASGDKWVSERARLEFDEFSKLTKALGTVQDITEKKKTENVLTESEALYRNLFNHSPSAIGIIDKETLSFLEVNETGTKLYGYSREEFMHLSGYDIRVPEDHGKLDEQLKAGIYASDLDARPHRKKNGEIIMVEPSIREIVYKGRDAFLITINDVTEKLNTEAALMNANNNRQKEIKRAILEAEEQSRAAIGRELHDNINQLLFASTLYFKKVTPATERDRELMHTGKGIINNAIEEIRKLSWQFVPPSLKELSLEGSIESLAEKFKLTDTVVDFDILLDESKLAEELKLNIYRIIQEQFSNILRHAHATEVTVQLKYTDDKLTLVIQDNGKGFDQLQKAKGIGLGNILQRAEAYNGKVIIDSSPGNGCKISVSFT